MTWLALLGWGTLVGLDLVSGPQVMIARPLVAATVAGAILGDVGAGLAVGTVLELFALEVLPIGAARYPDYGPAAVAAAAAAAHAPLVLALGVGVTLGLLVAWIGGIAMHRLRGWNARRVHRHVKALDAGDGRELARLHFTCLAADAARSAAVTAAGLCGAGLLRNAGILSVRAAIVAGTVVAAFALATAATGMLRVSGGGAARWLALGAALGVTLAVVA